MAGDIERRAAGEVRVEGRRLIGTAMRYGEVSPSHKERFSPGAFRMAETVILDMAHDRERAIAWTGMGLSFEDGAVSLDMRAELPHIPAADRAIDEIRTRKANGLSVEFRALKEHLDGGIRVIDEAELRGVGIVSRPSYEGARVEARRAKRRLKTWL